MTVWKVYQTSVKSNKLEKESSFFESRFSVDRERLFKLAVLLLALLFATTLLLASYRNNFLFFKELAFSLFISLSLTGLRLFNKQSTQTKK